MSETELAKALTAVGRSVSASTVRYWRVKGLLPPFVGYHGAGRGRGRKYYWLGREILDQAKITFDILKRHQKLDPTLQFLWLAGFDVPLARLRRSLLRTRPTPTQWTILPTPHQAGGFTPRRSVFSDRTIRAQDVLTGAAAVICSTFELRGQTQSKELIQLIGIALESTFGDPRPQLIPLKNDYSGVAAILGKILPEILASNVVALASNLELQEARRHFRKVFSFLEGALARTVEAPLVLDPLELLMISVPLYHVVLALLHSRQTATIEWISDQIDAATSNWGPHG